MTIMACGGANRKQSSNPPKTAECVKGLTKVSPKQNKNTKRLAAALRQSLHSFTLSERFSADERHHRVKGDIQAEKDEWNIRRT